MKCFIFVGGSQSNQSGIETMGLGGGIVGKLISQSNQSGIETERLADKSTAVEGLSIEPKRN